MLHTWGLNKTHSNHINLFLQCSFSLLPSHFLPFFFCQIHRNLYITRRFRRGLNRNRMFNQGSNTLVKLMNIGVTLHKRIFQNKSVNTQSPCALWDKSNKLSSQMHTDICVKCTDITELRFVNQAIMINELLPDNHSADPYIHPQVP